MSLNLELINIQAEIRLAKEQRNWASCSYHCRSSFETDENVKATTILADQFVPLCLRMADQLRMDPFSPYPQSLDTADLCPVFSGLWSSLEHGNFG